MENNIRQFRPKQNMTSQEPVKKELFYFDYTFLLVMIFLVGFGLVMVYSASYYEAMQEFNNPNHYVKKQAIAIALGFVGTYAAYKVPYKWYRKLGFLPYLACIVVILMALTLTGNIQVGLLLVRKILKQKIIIYYVKN